MKKAIGITLIIVSTPLLFYGLSILKNDSRKNIGL